MLNWDDPIGSKKTAPALSEATGAAQAAVVGGAIEMHADHDEHGGKTGLDGIETGAGRVDVSEKRIINATRTSTSCCR